MLFQLCILSVLPAAGNEHHSANALGDAGVQHAQTNHAVGLVSKSEREGGVVLF